MIQPSEYLYKYQKLLNLLIGGLEGQIQTASTKKTLKVRSRWKMRVNSAFALKSNLKSEIKYIINLIKIYL